MFGPSSMSPVYVLDAPGQNPFSPRKETAGGEGLSRKGAASAVQTDCEKCGLEHRETSQPRDRATSRPRNPLLIPLDALDDVRQIVDVRLARFGYDRLGLRV